jgi:hypothetical protein
MDPEPVPDLFDALVHADETESAARGIDIESHTVVVNNHGEATAIGAEYRGHSIRPTVLDGVPERLLRYTIETQHDNRRERFGRSRVRCPQIGD